ncbi:MAG: bifunctional precorrin-2 dehydrogenase/sirohydrochlorin ferrochelatase [Thermodesulfobacteriota bacterium]
MRYYPAFLDLSGRRCLIVGAGRVGRRKLAGLLALDPGRRPLEILVLDPGLGPDSDLPQDPAVVYVKRPFRDDDLEGRALVFAASSDPEANARVARLCAERGIPCNCADAPAASGFIVPASASRGGLTLAVSTAGGSPALARLLREELEAEFVPRWAALAAFMERLRPLVLGLGQDSDDNAPLFRALVRSGLGAALAAGDRERAAAVLRDLLPRELASRIEELTHGMD